MTIAIATQFEYITSAEAMSEALDVLRTSQAIALDTETARPRDAVKLAAYDNVYNRTKSGELAPFDPHTAEVRLIQMKGENTGVYVIDLWSLSAIATAYLASWMQSYAGVYISHNAKFELKQIRGSLGIWIDDNASIFDTMQASVLLANSVGMGSARGHGLKDLCRDFLDVVVDKEEQSSDWSLQLTAEQLDYAANDVVHLHALRQFLSNSLIKRLGQAVPLQLEMNVIGPTARMEWNGLPFSPEIYAQVQEAARFALPELLSKIGRYFKDTIGAKITAQRVGIDKADGTIEFKTYLMPYFGGKSGSSLMNARPKIKAMLIELGLVDDEGEPIDSTQRADLEAYKVENPGVGYLLDYWALFKQTQFSYADYVHPLTGRCHPTFIISGAGTGRFSSKNFNAQQIPTKMTLVHPVTGTKLNFRYCFKAEDLAAMDIAVKDRILDGRVHELDQDDDILLVASADFSGQELTVMAKLSGDQLMIDTINNDGDLHSEAAAGMFGIAPGDARNPIPGLGGITYRDRGKIIMFSLAYGKTAKGFAIAFGITEAEAKKLIAGFKKRFKALTDWLEYEGNLAAAQGFSVLANGAIRFLGGDSDRNGKTRQGANYQIQGLSSWATRLAMITLDTEIKVNNYPIWPAACIHDELLSTLRASINCCYARWCLGLDVEDKRLKAELKLAKAAKDKATEKQLEKAVDARRDETKVECESVCVNQHCATRYHNVIGAAMKAGAVSVLEGVVKPGYDLKMAAHWSH